MLICMQQWASNDKPTDMQSLIFIYISLLTLQNMDKIGSGRRNASRFQQLICGSGMASSSVASPRPQSFSDFKNIGGFFMFFLDQNLLKLRLPKLLTIASFDFRFYGIPRSNLDLLRCQKTSGRLRI